MKSELQPTALRHLQGMLFKTKYVLCTGLALLTIPFILAIAGKLVSIDYWPDPEGFVSRWWWFICWSTAVSALLSAAADTLVLRPDFARRRWSREWLESIALVVTIIFLLATRYLLPISYYFALPLVVGSGMTVLAYDWMKERAIPDDKSNDTAGSASRTKKTTSRSGVSPTYAPGRISNLRQKSVEQFFGACDTKEDWDIGFTDYCSWCEKHGLLPVKLESQFQEEFDRLKQRPATLATVVAFLQERLDRDQWETADYQSYTAWCANGAVPMATEKDFGEQLNAFSETASPPYLAEFLDDALKDNAFVRIGHTDYVQW